MKTIARVTLAGAREGGDGDASPAAVWRAIAERSFAWAAEAGATWRDAVVLVPFLEMLAPARQAFARLGAWMPRIETTRTLAAALGPPLGGAGDSGFDAALDILVATQLLAREPWGAEWSARDPRGFEHAAARLATTAHEIRRAAAAVGPQRRDAWWQAARDALRGAGGPAVKERVLAQVAIEWAAAAPAAESDRLFALRPSAWIAVEAGGAEALTSAVLEHDGAPALVIETDASLAAPFELVATRAGEAPAFALCDGFEDEASAAAAQVLDHLARDERPVALIALDRVLVRRVRALLERAGATIDDESGWKLSTTRAGATVMTLLVAARRDASSDAYLDWLKSLPVAAATHGSALSALESATRRAGAAHRDAIGALALDAGTTRLHQEAMSTLQAFESPARRPLLRWLEALGAALERCGALQTLRDDPAGRQVLAALALDPPLAGEREGLAAELEAITLAEFTHWVDDIFERVTYRPPSASAPEQASSARADVVVTPLARAMLRPFAAAVVPGADERKLGALTADNSLLPPGVAAMLGLRSAPVRRDAEILAFAQLLRLPRVTLLRRRGNDAEPRAESPLVERLRLALAERGRSLRNWCDPRVVRAVEPAPIRAGAPSVRAAALPRRLSATAFEALRACPYRFFARSVLGLGEADELDDEVEKRDYGSWLHAVLHAFHVERDGAPARADAASEAARLRAIGEAKRAERGIDAAAFLPYDASFAAFVPRYVAWLHERERDGWQWSAGEIELTRAPAELEGVELFGRIDRIDRRDRDGASTVELIDYKTGGADKLKKAVREPLEDTQLAFYAALAAERGEPIRASYLALDGTRKLEQIAHDDVASSAHALVRGAAAELRRIREGTGLAPLGAGAACDYCLARGLCRRDHWTVAVAAAPARDGEGADGSDERAS